MNFTRTKYAELTDPSVSTKRLAWAFGCAKRDSEEELELYRILRDRILEADRKQAAGVPR